MSDTESHGPTEIWTLIVCPECDFYMEDDEATPGYCPDYKAHPLGDYPELERITVARPEDIRSRVCQELAEALREKAARETPRVDEDDSTKWAGGMSRARGIAESAEFVEQFGTDRGGEG